MSLKDPNQVPEVAEFLALQEKLKNFEQLYPDLFQEYGEIVAEYNSALERADKTVRAAGISCGPFIKQTERVTYDAAKLYEMVGRDEFLRMGGKLATVTEFDLDKTKFKSLVQSNQIPADLAKDVTKVTAAYSAPKPIKLG